MALNIGSLSKYPNRVTVWIGDDGKIKISSARKDKRLPEGKQYVNTYWFVRFVGDANEKSKSLQNRDRIEILSGNISQEAYEKDGVKTYPKAPQVNIFDFKIVSKGDSGSSGFDTPPAVEEDDLDNIPF